MICWIAVSSDCVEEEGSFTEEDSYSIEGIIDSAVKKIKETMITGKKLKQFTMKLQSCEALDEGKERREKKGWVLQCISMSACDL